MVVMPVLGRGDQDRVDVLAVKQNAVVTATLSLRSGNLQPGVQVHVIYVTDGAPLGTQILEILPVPATHAASTDDAHYDALIRAKDLSAECGVGQYAQSYCRRASHESSSCHSVTVHSKPPRNAIRRSTTT